MARAAASTVFYLCGVLRTLRQGVCRAQEARGGQGGAEAAAAVSGKEEKSTLKEGRVVEVYTR